MTLDTAECGGLDPRTALTELDGVGPRTAERLARAGIGSLRDLLCWFPRRHVEVVDVDGPDDELLGLEVRFTGHVRRVQLAWLPGRRSIVSITLGTPDGSEVKASFFNQPYLAKSYRVGMDRTVEGRLDKSGSTFVVKQPRIAAPSKAAAGPVTMQYPDVEGVSDARLRGWIRQAIERVAIDSTVVPALPPGLRGDVRSPVDAIRAMHLPRDVAEHERAREYFALLEAVELFRRLERIRRDRATREGVVVEVDDSHERRVASLLPFEWTPDQAEAVKALRGALGAGSPFGMLLHGDVGTGKTAVAFDAALAVLDAGFQVALLAPTELLAEQHAASFRGWLERVDVDCELLLGSLPADDRRRLDARLASGEARFVVGTHALFSEQTEFARLGLVIIDEQHRFGVRQRARLVEKGRAPHVLVMTATPIPRTLTLTLFGDLDAVALADRPGGRGLPPALFVPRERWTRVVDSIRRAVDGGGRVYVVCPRVGEKGEKGGAVRMHDELATQFDTRLVHGRQPREERQAATAAFRDGSCQVLVGTTVLEVGIDVAEATLIVVVGAENFGIATLHQLRGRVGRGARRGLCILTGDANARTAAVCRTRDGFALAEHDLTLRGAGELLGARQSGLGEFRALDPIADFSLLERARRAVRDEP